MPEKEKRHEAPQLPSNEVQFDLESPVGVIKWVAKFVPHFFSAELPNLSLDPDLPRNRDTSIEQLHQAVRVYLLMNNYFNDCQNLTPEVKSKISKADYEQIEKKAKDRRKMARRAIATYEDSMKKLNVIPEDLKIPKKLPETFPSPSSLSESDELTDTIFLMSCYLHDIKNQVIILRNYLELFDTVSHKPKSENYQKLDELRQLIQMQIYHILVINYGFDLLGEAEDERKASNAMVLLNYIQTFVRKEATANKVNPFIEKKDRVDISFYIDNNLDDQELLNRLNVGFTIPDFLRVFTNVMQNIRRYYFKDHEQEDVTRQLRVNIAFDATKVVMVFDDDGHGFPVHKKTTKESAAPDSASDVLDRSQFDEEPIVAYFIEQKKTSGKGSGLGLAGIEKIVQHAGGSILAGNRTSSRGARVEIVLPVTIANDLVANSGY